ncbi:nuclear transport factor 2 family protein [Actinomadura rugatobispora]|uniref:Nuclear transport factor 2 family protein n=1 Tax=Actinomadura rugatobispora TaxID=1994 RepID=A0ABW0ZYH8_9ACTN|nr:hypothetical protein GCM10010200_091220 [Actinomadura rugatobispora]
MTSQQIRAQEDIRYQAMLDADIATLDRLFDEALVYTHSSGLVDGKKTYLEGVRDATFDYRSIVRSDETILVRGDHALVSNRCRMDIYVSGVRKALDNHVLAVWSKAGDGAWRFLALHSTPVGDHAPRP